MMVVTQVSQAGVVIIAMVLAVEVLLTVKGFAVMLGG